MKKEVVLAIALGLVVGLIITFGIYNAQKAFRSVQTVDTTGSEQEQQEREESGAALIISSPEDNSIQSISTAIVAGTTTPNSDIVIFLDGTPLFTKADSAGVFSQTVKLETESNVITVVGIDQSGKQQTASRLVVFTTVDLDNTSTTSARPKTATSSSALTSTSSAEQTTQNLKDRIERVLEEKLSNGQKPIAYIGTIERVGAENLTLKTSAGVKIVQFSEETGMQDYQNGRKLTPKDLEIDSSALVMGYMSNDVFEARRILLSKATFNPPPRRVVAGTLMEIGKTLVRIFSRSSEELAFPMGRLMKYEDRTSKPLLKKDVMAGDKLIAILDNSDPASPSAILLHFLKEKETLGATASGKAQ